jgi:hypothetical protein
VQQLELLRELVPRVQQGVSVASAREQARLPGRAPPEVGLPGRLRGAGQVWVPRRELRRRSWLGPSSRR